MQSTDSIHWHTSYQKRVEKNHDHKKEKKVNYVLLLPPPAPRTSCDADVGWAIDGGNGGCAMSYLGGCGFAMLP
jgi:hypothetical protein